MLAILLYTAGENVTWIVFLEGNLAIRKRIHDLTRILLLGIYPLKTSEQCTKIYV